MATEQTKATRVLLETVVLIGVALALALVIKTLFAQAFYIPSGSMKPGLVQNDRILVQKMSYWFGEPDRGEVVVFEDPGSWLTGSATAGPTSPVAKVMARIGLYPTGGHLVKRVIGVEGDVIECCDDEGRLLVNGVALDESDYIDPQRTCNGPMPGNCRWQAGPVPPDSLFVMGDNRDQSADSSVRLCPPGGRDGCDPTEAFVPVDLVVGKVFTVVWPFDHWDLIGTPGVFDEVPEPGN